MDLYKWCHHAELALPSELTLAAFDLGRRIRQLDMAASPYDLFSVGLAPVPIETAADRAEYVAQQRALAEQDQALRARVLDTLTLVLARLPA